MSPTWITALFCPILGDIISNIMFATSLPAILKARANNDIGNINPIPYGVTVMNCVGWTIYGVMQRDFFIFFGNMPGGVLSIFYTVSSLVLLARRGESKDVSMYRLLESIFLAALVFWGVMGMIVGIAMGPQDAAMGSFIVGLIVSGCGLAYYVAPLSTVRQVIVTRNASSLYAPMIVMNLVNALLWFVYGFVAAGDLFVWGPNAVGITLACIQLSLIGLYGSGPKGMQAMHVATSSEEVVAVDCNNPMVILGGDIELGEAMRKEIVENTTNTVLSPFIEGAAMLMGAGGAGPSPTAASALTHVTPQHMGTPGDPYAFVPLPGSIDGVAPGTLGMSDQNEEVTSTLETTVSALHI